jgi:hypothetical protein
MSGVAPLIAHRGSGLTPVLPAGSMCGVITTPATRIVAIIIIP